MSENTSPSFDSRTGGVRHLPEADIESIRDLLRGYGSGASILKELIQNAEDAGAKRMDVLYLPGSRSAPHSLLQGPSLLVINDGTFKPEHRDAITQINMGTKGTEERAIGRFGKGLKSVFAWCEAFFIIARTDPQWEWKEATIADLFNPWHGWLHEDWETDFTQQAEAIARKAEDHFSNIYDADKPWLAFWFPLRQQQQAEDEWIEQRFPGDDPNFWQAMARELRELAPSLVTLRSLNKLALLDRKGGAGDSHVLQFPTGGERIPTPNTTPEQLSVGGVISLSSKDRPELAYRFCGIAGRIQDSRVIQLKQQEGWPKVVQRVNGQKKASAPVKGEPHFASLITWHPLTAKESMGSLDLRWCVFFPVGKQPTSKERISLASLKKHITVNLHGFFFLDSERLRIDGLEDQFKANRSNDRDTCIEWNQFIAKQGVLANLPKALHDFAQSENLLTTECAELAEAMRQTWEWKCYQSNICQQATWRPRWRAGEETWECLPTTTSVLPIPTIANPQELSSCLPMLSRISEEQVLVTKADDGTMQGLHNGLCGRWSEALLMRLFSSVNVSATGNESTIRWINSFLAELKQTNCLTPRIYGHISTLPLLKIINARTNMPRRISGKEWESLCQKNQLFALPIAGEKWLALLCEAFQDIPFIVADSYLPHWFTGSLAPNCNETIAARLVLRQANLGSFSTRTKLWNALASLPQRTPLVILALRYLMHADSANAEDESTSLWISSSQPDQQIWFRVFDYLYKEDGGTKSKRLLPSEWVPLLSPTIREELKIITIDAEGAWNELMQNQGAISNLVFPIDEWPDKDIATLLQGLYQAGKSKSTETLKLLRRLCVHKLAGNSELRVSVADSNGQLDEHYVLHTQDFEAGIPAELKPIWQAFLAETKIIERFPSDVLAGGVQEQIFQRLNEQGTPYLVELNWNYVVRRCLEAAEPGKRAALILQAFAKQGSQAASGLTEKLRKIKWLPLELGEYIDPGSVVYIEGLDEDLNQLLDPVKDGLAGIHALAESVKKHPGFKTLSSYFPRSKETFEMLRLWMDEKPNWHLGLTKQFQIAELQPLLAQLKDFETLPIANLLVKLCSLSEGNLVPLVQEYILPAVLKKFDYEQEGLNKIKDILCRLQSLKSREAFDAYLQQACKDSIIRELLPELYLVNQRGEWNSARQLIWPSENLDLAVQLCDEQAKILSPLHNESAKHESPAVGKEQGLTQTRGNQLLEPPDFDAQVEKLNEYLRPFEAGNVGVNLMSALIAVLGGHPGINALLQKLLQTGIGQSPEVFLSRLFGEQGESLFTSPERFLIDIVRTSGIETYSLTDEPLTVALTDEIKTLIVGNSNDLWFNYFYKNQRCHVLRLRWIEDPDSLTDLVNVFAKTVETIYLKVHCNGFASSCPSNLKETLADIADAGQVALRRSQLYLLDMAEARLRELGVKGMPQFQEILQEFDDARQARVDAEDLSVQAPPKAQQRRKQADEKRRSATDRLVKLLEGAESADVRHELVQAVRRKMTDFQYSLASVLQELFQNADDAVAEWKEMRQALEPLQERFVLHLSNERRTLEIFHWGRPINQCESPGFTAGRSRGYDQDLVKMLTLNFSDKGVGKETGQSIVTGLFGLGFKSVFFVAEEPQVISGRLAFEIRGGFYPAALNTKVANEMRQKAEELGAAAVTPTAIRLQWKGEDDLAADLKHAIAKFRRIAPLLTIFSRHLQTLIVSDDEKNDFWTMVEQPLTESGSVTYGRVRNHHYLCFRCPLASEQYPAMILFQLNPDGITSLEEDLTGLWITTPTAERSQMRWALNAPFKPDAGRQQLALTNQENKIIANKVAEAWGTTLLEFFDETEKNWQSVTRKLELHKNVGSRKWWQQLWQETTRDAPILQWSEVRAGGQVLNWIAWGESVGAMRMLIEERAAIPSDLPGEYEKLLKLNEVKYVLNGVLAKTDNGCFAQIETWDSLRLAFPPGYTVSQGIGGYLRQISSSLSLELLTIRKVLATEVGTQNQVSPASADRIGSLLGRNDSIFETYSQVWNEDGLREWMTQLMFRAQDGSYCLASELVCGRQVTDLIEKDEALRAPFAPEGAVLFTGYSDSAIRLFVKARVRLAANAMLMAEWVQQVSDSEKLSAVFIYIVEGELGQALADKLGYTWLETKRDTSAFKSLSEEQRNEVERKFSKGRVWNTFNFQFSIPTPIERPVKQMMDAKDAFCRVWHWWNQKGNKYVKDYEEKTYSISVPTNLPWPGEDAWEKVTIPSPHTQWLLLFVRAALVPLGFNNIGRDQGFLQFLNDRNLLEAFGNSSNEPQAILEAIDEWLDSSLENTQFHFQMRQFVAFYAVARNLEDFLESLRAADAQGTAYTFQNVFSPKANSSLIGTGITAPPITGMLGMGSCQLLRELFRFGRLSNPAGFPYAFTPLRKVRRLCTQLFGTEYKSEGARSSLGIFANLQRLGSELGLDPTFNRCFDLPFQFLAEKESLCKDVLGQSLNGEQLMLSADDTQSDLEDFYGTDEPS